MITQRFQYQSFDRTSIDGKRYYMTPDGDRLQSVTTILDATKPAEQKAALQAWRKRMGEQQAQQITTEAANRGTRMHRYLEQYVTEDSVKEPGSNPYSQQSHRMATAIIDQYLKPHCTAFYGTEINLFYPDLYAGTTDCIADWQGQLSIMDFKQTNRPKKESFIESYFLQVCAYALAHNQLYGTDIQQGVILMCSQNYEPQHWVISGAEFQRYSQIWAERVNQFYS